MLNSRKLFWWVTFYSIAMGLLETAVVVYLRKMYYPHGFSFPLTPVHDDIAIVELWRELATLVMLLSIGVLAGRNRVERFAYFLYSFAIWDICYYIFLKVFIDWPESLMTWDILFLLPVPWVGPVITPCIIAATMILYTLTVIRYTNEGLSVIMTKKERWLLWSGAFIVIVSFTMDYVEKKGATLWHNMFSDNSLFMNLVDYVPQHFNWPYFILGEGLILAAWFMYRNRLNKLVPQKVI